MSNHLLSLVTFTPLLGMILLLFVNGKNLKMVRTVGLAFSSIPLLWALWILAAHNSADAGFQLVEKALWLRLGASTEIYYHLGVDGISVPMVLLTAILSCIAGVASLSIDKRAKEYWIYYLLLQVGMYGTFVALDLFIFYIFWEIGLIPMFFLIGIWGGPRREYAALKFFLYTLAGSVLMLIGFFILGLKLGTLQFPELIAQAPTLTHGIQFAVFFLLFIGFAIKVPVWPFHTWLPDAHVEAPTPISVILAGVLLKMGTYGLFRFSLPLSPAAASSSSIMLFLAVLGVIGIVYGAYVAFAQTDFKKLVAYSSVSHMGFVLLGLASLTTMGAAGAYFQSFSHGLLSGAMFLLVGVIYDRAHTRDMDSLGGLFVKMPIYGGILLFFAMGSLGLPGLSGFIAEIFSMAGAWKAFPWLVAITGLGVIMTGGYTVTMIRRVLLGPEKEKWAALPDINRREVMTLVPLAILTLVLGVYPRLLNDVAEPSIAQVIEVSGRAVLDSPTPESRLGELGLSYEDAEEFAASINEHHGDEGASDHSAH